MVVSCSSLFCAQLLLYVVTCLSAGTSVCLPYHLIDHYFVIRAKRIVQDMVNLNYVSFFLITGYKDLH